MAFSCTSPAFHHGLFLAMGLKLINPKIHTVFGGWHPTALPEDTLANDCVDQVITGEGEVEMLKVVLGSRQPIMRGKNLWEGNFLWPDRHAIRNSRTISLCEMMNLKRTASFQLNRGCKVHCKFCSEIKMTGRYSKNSNPIRTRSCADLITEIDVTNDAYNLDYFKLVDATFDKDTKTVIDFCEAKINRENSIPWEANIHPAFAQDEVIFPYLGDANCKQINVGCESGSQKILNQIGKGTKIEHIKNVFRWAKDYGIERRAFFLLGMPDESSRDILETIRLIDEIQPDVVGFTILAPYPGTDFYDPQLHKDVDWSKVDEYSNDIWRSNHFTNDELKLIQASLINKYSGNLCERQA